MEIAKKAWVINTNDIRDSWFAPEDVFYSDSRGKAKSMIWNHIKYDGLENTWGNEITFLNLKISRAKGADKYLVGGELKTLSKIKSDEEYKERNDDIDRLVRENPTAMAYIKKGGYYYRPNSSGYTEYTTKAGVYTVQEAASSVKSTSLRDYMRMIIIDNEEHNEMILEAIADLETKLINS